ncbi:hypothetical protein GFER_05470 [Geoalkalibacter ferrihydriticus DSM 17813]|uniref:Uncharacterized protein n=1 Tax=Geoalkalibacter ferrihydriticus DSM 17813 TaxID=1121915 RepID=A0A0C2HLP7_9BACT|nr:hypothetical protein GFER_05470 [Geoalkalibacter ferrihydriticus DSM 17813]
MDLELPGRAAATARLVRAVTTIPVEDAVNHAGKGTQNTQSKAQGDGYTFKSKHENSPVRQKSQMIFFIRPHIRALIS